MTTPAAGSSPAKQPPPFRLPDIPEKDPNDMASSKHLARNGNMYRLAHHLGKPDTTIVSGERYICAEPGSTMRYPGLLVSFDADPKLYESNNGYLASLQAKPPDLVLEIASRATGHMDKGEKRDFYASLGIAEYWRFDETGEFHGEKLGGDRLIDGAYRSIPVETLADGRIRSYSRLLGLYICWEMGNLEFYDPETGSPLPSLDSLGEELQAEQQQREIAESRIRQLEEQLRQSQP